MFYCNKLCFQFSQYVFFGCFILTFYACIKKETIPHNYLIEVEDALHIMEHSTKWRLFEISKDVNYQKGHIAGAFNLWRPDYSDSQHPNFSGMRANKVQLEKLLSKYGVDNQTTLLLYDEKGNCDAARFAWQLELWGFENLHLINGGKKSWQLLGLALNQNVPELPPFNNFRFKQQDEKRTLLADYEEVYLALEDTNSIIVDTRELYEFTGAPFEKNGQQFLYKKGAFTNGAILKAKHYNWSNAVDLKTDHQLKDMNDLEYDLKAAGIQTNKNIILYCQSGTRSAHTSFVLRHILQYPNVKNYDGSWIEWSYLNTHNLKDTPIKVRH